MQGYLERAEWPDHSVVVRAFIPQFLSHAALASDRLALTNVTSLSNSRGATSSTTTPRTSFISARKSVHGTICSESGPEMSLALTIQYISPICI